MIVRIVMEGKPIPKETMTRAQVKKAISSWYQPKTSQEATKLARIRNTLSFQEAIAWQCKGKPQLTGYVQLTLKVFLKEANGKLPEDRGDIDNYHKSVVDGLQYGGIFAPVGKRKKGNDKAVIRYGVGAGIYPTDGPERVEIELEEIDL